MEGTRSRRGSKLGCTQGWQEWRMNRGWMCSLIRRELMCLEQRLEVVQGRVIGSKNHPGWKRGKVWSPGLALAGPALQQDVVPRLC